MPTLALEALDGGFWTLDLATREFKTSRRLAEKIAGPGHASLDLAEYVGHIHADDLRLDLPDGDHEVTVEFRVFTYEGRMLWLQTRRRPVCDSSGRATHVVGIVLDITPEIHSTIAPTSWIISDVRLSCLTSPLTSVRNSRSAGSTSVSIHGPSGQNVS